MLAQIADLCLCALMFPLPYVLALLCPCALMYCAFLSLPLCCLLTSVELYVCSMLWLGSLSFWNTGTLSSDHLTVILDRFIYDIQDVHKVLHTFKILISQKPHMVETLDFRQ